MALDAGEFFGDGDRHGAIQSALQNALVEKFPNISMIDVSRMVKKILEVIDRISFAINFMALISIIAGLVVVFSIARQEVQRRLWEINLLKVLGAGFTEIRWIIMIEFGLLGFMASLSGIIVSIILSYGISFYYFERLWSLNPAFNLSTLVAISLICGATAMAAAGKAIRQKPAALLHAH